MGLILLEHIVDGSPANSILYRYENHRTLKYRQTILRQRTSIILYDAFQEN